MLEFDAYHKRAVHDLTGNLRCPNRSTENHHHEAGNHESQIGVDGADWKVRDVIIDFCSRRKLVRMSDPDRPPRLSATSAPKEPFFPPPRGVNRSALLPCRQCHLDRETKRAIRRYHSDHVMLR
jgi:hypothetical protein